MSERMSGL
jgi:hypothetical protein